MKIDNDISTEEILNKERNFITKNSLIIMFSIVALMSLGLSKINVPVYKNVRMEIIKDSFSSHRVYLKNTSNLKFEKDDTIQFIYGSGKGISLVKLKKKKINSTIYKISNTLLENDTLFKSKDYINGKIVLRHENLVKSIFNSIKQQQP